MKSRLQKLDGLTHKELKFNIINGTSNRRKTLKIIFNLHI